MIPHPLNRPEQSDSPARLRLTGPLTHHHGGMANGSNAGIHRNRGPAGTKVETIKVGLFESRVKQMDEARGNLSRGLFVEYLMQLAEQSNGGKLPTPAPTLIDTEESATTAA